MITGGCRCGEIEFSCSEKPHFVSTCHCMDCQKFSGSSFINWALFRSKAISMGQGRPKEVSCTEGVYRGFCRDCGTHLYWRRSDRPQWVDITVGSLDQPLPYEPQAEAYVAHKLPWVILNPNIPHYDYEPFDLPAVTEG
ncbi:MAG: GFA family protein [Cellvibrionaceae bacterium]